MKYLVAREERLLYCKDYKCTEIHRCFAEMFFTDVFVVRIHFGRIANMFKRVIVLVACILLRSAALVYGQEGTQVVVKNSSSATFSAPLTHLASEFFGGLLGKIVDKASGEAIADAYITLTDLEGDLTELLSTPPHDSSRTNGEVLLLNLKPSRYSMECAATGFKRFAREFLVVVVVGEPIRFRVEMVRE
jgi:hypothetical protein